MQFAQQHGLKIDHRRRPHRVPPPHREARAPRRRRSQLPTATASSRPSATRSVVDGSHAPGARQGRRRRQAATCWCACTPSASPATSSARCAATAASSSHEAHAAHRGGGPRRHPLHAPGGPRHRPAQQAEGLRAAGAGPRHRGGQRGARLRRPTCATTASAPRSWSTSACRRIRLMTNNPKKIVGARGLRPARSPSACRIEVAPHEDNVALPAHQEGQDGPPARARGPARRGRGARGLSRRHGHREGAER